MLNQYHKETCKACNGEGIQTNKDGIRILCPVCGGNGFRWVGSLDSLPPGNYCMVTTSEFSPHTYGLNPKDLFSS